ncbi:hypothetical protein [Clostridium oryzae]|uniref:Uncharacterized protein n=1 Tax=Clostridium oryzae TaxID=1450648 RepID=A0A1V4IIL4_9CLOT|nr:hypothetical protein [Clostridium oryzae]OPJ59337.1 hypothetical protein CLORY_33460 [Clostridium oryzae]
MFFQKRKAMKEKVENEKKLNKLQDREVRYVTTRDENNIETIIGKYGFITIEDGIFIIKCNDKEVFKHGVSDLQGSELMSLDGIILSYTDKETGIFNEVIAYYKYHRK